MGYGLAAAQVQNLAQRARLICLDGSVLLPGGSGIVISLQNSELTVGRSEHCQVRIPVRHVSRYHARLTLGSGGWAVEDLDSTNGVYVNGRRLTAGWLHNGDDIRFGPVAFQYSTTGDDREDPAAPAAVRTALDWLTLLPAQRWDPGILVLDAARGHRAILVEAGMRAGCCLYFGDGRTVTDHLRCFEPEIVAIDLTQSDSSDLAPIVGAIAESNREIPLMPIVAAGGGIDSLQEELAGLGLTLMPPLSTPLDIEGTFGAVASAPGLFRRTWSRRSLQTRRHQFQFMPRIEIETNRVVGAEVVGRGLHRDSRPPEMARDTVLAGQDDGTGEAVFAALQTGIALLRELAPHHPDFLVSLDLPQTCLLQADFVERLVGMLDAAGVEPSQLVLGIGTVQATAIDGPIPTTLRWLRRHGVGLSIGELRIGQSAKDEWRAVGITELRLDQGLVAVVLDVPHAAALIQTTVGLARLLGLRTVATGVESLSILEWLRSIGCDHAQGLVIGRAMARGEFLDWLDASRPGRRGAARCAPCQPAGQSGCPAPGRHEGCADAVKDETAVQAPVGGRAPLRTHNDPAVARFLAAVSHELRTPLNAILGFSEIMEAELFGPLGSDRYRTYAKDIRESGNHLHQIVGNLLDLYESERSHAAESTVPVRHLISASLKAIEAQAARRRIALESDVPAGIPGLWADEVRLQQILVNLIGNLVRSAPEGSRVTVGARRTAEGGVSLWVADTTGESPAGPAQEVLLPCCDGKTVCPHRADCGVDLPLTKALAEAHGAELHLGSSSGFGTAATITFPADRLGTARPSGGGPVGKNCAA